MAKNLTPQARAVLELAREEARRLQHEYVGTEHMLLGLIAEEKGIAASVLRSRGLDYTAIHRELELLVQVGPAPVTTQELPLTPRALQAIQFAEEDARMVGQSQVDTEHLLTGLLREPDGVAGVILRKLGFQLAELGAEVFRVRLLQMKVVERVVRPVQANISRKRRMRDEMLAHLSAIYDDELARSDDPAAAVAAAAQRFGDPTELTAELQATVPFLERLEVAADSFGFGWRPPETVLRWMSRLAVRIGMVMLTTWVLAAFFALREFGWNVNALGVLRPIAALAVALPFSAAISGICYFNIRDHIYGVFGSKKSWRCAFAWAGLLAFVTAGCGLAFLAIAYGSFSPADTALYPSIAVGMIWAAGALVSARNLGPQEIRDTTWALLDLSDHPAAA